MSANYPYFQIILSYEIDATRRFSLDTNCLNDWFHREHPQLNWPTHKRDANLLIRLVEEFVGYPFTFMRLPPDPEIARKEWESGAEERRIKADREYRQSVGTEEKIDTGDHSTDPAYNLP